MSTDKFLESLITGDTDETSTEFNSLMAEKITDAMEVAKVEVASGLFAVNELDKSKLSAYSKKSKAKKIANEEVEQIDELKSKTLANYIKQASHDVTTKGALTRQFSNDARAAYKDQDFRTASRKGELSDKTFNKSWERRKFIAKAADKLAARTNEEVEQIDENDALTHELRHESGKLLKIGDTVKDFRGNLHKITGFSAPRNSASSGRVHTDSGSFYPSVIDAKIVAKGSVAEGVYLGSDGNPTTADKAKTHSMFAAKVAAKKHGGTVKQDYQGTKYIVKLPEEVEQIEEVADAAMQDPTKLMQAHRMNLQKMNVDSVEKSKVLAALKNHIAGKRLNLAQNTALTGYLERAGGLGNVSASIRNKALKQK